MISKEKEFIFIHNFKTGGTSIEKKLGHFDMLERDVQDHRTIREIEALTNRKMHFRKSIHALRKGKPGRSWHWMGNFISPEITKIEYDRFYKFSFVRNSWARMYSWYVNVMRDEAMLNSYGIEDPSMPYERFLTEVINAETFSQWYFITNSRGEIPLDFIGRFENLQEDFNKVCERLEIDDSELPKLLVRKYGHYSENYTDKTKDLVYKLFRKEIEQFGFEFGE